MRWIKDEKELVSSLEELIWRHRQTCSCGIAMDPRCSSGRHQCVENPVAISSRKRSRTWIGFCTQIITNIYINIIYIYICDYVCVCIYIYVCMYVCIYHINPNLIILSADPQRWMAVRCRQLWGATSAQLARAGELERVLALERAENQRLRGAVAEAVQFFDIKISGTWTSHRNGGGEESTCNDKSWFMIFFS